MLGSPGARDAQRCLVLALWRHDGLAGYARWLKSAVEQLTFDQHRRPPARGKGLEILFTDLEQRPLGKPRPRPSELTSKNRVLSGIARCLYLFCPFQLY